MALRCKARRKSPKHVFKVGRNTKSLHLLRYMMQITGFFLCCFKCSTTPVSPNIDKSKSSKQSSDISQWQTEFQLLFDWNPNGGSGDRATVNRGFCHRQPHRTAVVWLGESVWPLHSAQLCIVTVCMEVYCTCARMRCRHQPHHCRLQKIMVLPSEYGGTAGRVGIFHDL